MTTEPLSHHLSARLREATRQEHRRAEGRPLVRDLLGGRLDRVDYVVLLRNLHVVYERLEAGFDRIRADDPALDTFAPPEVRRREALEADLLALHGPRWESLAPVPEAAEFSRRLDTLAEEDPLLLVAHAYVRYLGDLSGGAVMGRMVARHYDLAEDGAGLAFYRFPEVADADAFKARYRDALDALETGGRSADLLEEARRSFRMNQALFDGVDRRRHSRAD